MGTRRKAAPPRDLSPLAGLTRLKALSIDGVPVRSLAPLAGLKLRQLGLHDTGVSDLSPLRGMPLRSIDGDLHPERDAAVLRDIKGLKAVNGRPAAAFKE